MGITEEEKPASQVGARRYARGRAYVPDRFTNPEGAEEATAAAAAESEYGESIDAAMEDAEAETVEAVETVETVDAAQTAVGADSPAEPGGETDEEPDTWDADADMDADTDDKEPGDEEN